MGFLDPIMDAAATAAGLRKKTVMPPQEAPRPQRRVKTPAEYEEEDRAAAEGKVTTGRDTQTHKLVPDSVYNYGEK